MMLQFLLGLSTLNVGWIIPSGGSRFYNSPPLVFIGFFVLLKARVFSIQILKIIGVIAAIGTVYGVINGFDRWHARQTVAFLAASIVWIFVYQQASRRDIFTMTRTKYILAVYFVYLLVILIENILRTDVVAYAISCIFSTGCGANIGYASSGRIPYFSGEASNAALAIAATIMPFICANAIANRNYRAYFLLFVGCIALYFAEGLTSLTFILFSMAFIIFPRSTVLSVPVLMLLIILVSAAVSSALEEKGAVVALVQTWFGGFDPRVDAGIESGSYTSRSMNWLIGARAFISSPLYGLGIGGTQSYFYELYDAGFEVLLGEEQGNILNGEVAAYSSPLVVRIPAELGVIGTAYLAYYGLRAMRLALERCPENPLLGYAFLYSFGVMLLSFCFAGELFNPCIPAFIALLAQVLHAKRTIRSREQSPAASSVTFTSQHATNLVPGVGKHAS